MQDSQDTTLAERLERVNTTIAAAAARVGRSVDEITLVAVSKTVDAAHVRQALRLGVRHLGENRVQEAVAKIAEIGHGDGEASPASPFWHLIGHLQTNKIRTAASLFALIESVDSTRLAAALDRQGREIGRPIDVLLEVNVGGETSKFGLAPGDVIAAYRAIAELPMIRVRGLMTVAPVVTLAEEARPFFRALREIRNRLLATYPGAELPHLSMGMTGDYPVAIEEGATIVRVGRAIFGERPATA
jgi:PLP dependent protein